MHLHHDTVYENVAFPPNAVFGNNIFIGTGSFGTIFNGVDNDDMPEITLQRLFGSESEIVKELQRQFDGLPIHRLVYYLS